MSFLTKIFEPFYYHREYENDFPVLIEKKEEEQSWLNLSKRVVLTSLPFLSLYRPFSMPISLAMGSMRSITSIQQLFQSENQPEFSCSLIQTTIAIIALAGTIFAHPIGMFVSTGNDLVMDVAHLVSHLREGAGEAALGDFLAIINNAFYLALFFHGGLELAVVSLALQMLNGLYHTQAEFKKDNYIEAIGHLGMFFVRGKQFVDQTSQLRQKWKNKSTQIVLKTHVISGEYGDKKVERRAVIDVGSGGTKVLIVDVDVETCEIVNIVLEKTVPVPYQAALEKSEDKCFDELVQSQGLDAFQSIKQLLDEHEVEAVRAIATEAFRKAKNGSEFANKVYESTGIPLKIISQKDEGLIAYDSALAVTHGDPKQTIVWDIGTGSFQITMKHEDGQYEVFDKGLGAVPFKNEILENIQHTDPKNPSVMTSEEYKQAGRFARRLARQASRDAKLKIKSKDVEIVGIGRLFQNSVYPVAGEDGTITRAGLRHYVRGVMDGSIEINPNDPYAYADFTNSIQVLEVMKALHIQEINIVNTASTKGLAVGISETFSLWGNGQSAVQTA